MTGASQAVVTIGFAYSGAVWKRAWPRAMANLLAAAEQTGARVVHVDNMYMYGPHDGPLSEETPMLPRGVKPKVRAGVTRLWQAAAAGRRVRWAALRAPDFYGPGVGNSHIGDTGLARLAQGRAAQMIMSPDIPHAFAYVPDIGRAVVSLLDAGDDVFNQVWHVPCAPARTPRQILRIGADALGVKLKMAALPGWALSALGLVVPALREFDEMRFTWDRPYLVDAAKFANRFWGDATPLEVGVPIAARAFRDAAETARATPSPGRALAV
jgi:nucleoside-diphosphate-sugar epimerase